MLEELKETINKELKETRKLVYEQIRNIENEIKNNKKEPNSNSGAENIIPEVKILEGIQ